MSRREVLLRFRSARSCCSNSAATLSFVRTPSRRTSTSTATSSLLNIQGKDYPVDSWTNLPPKIPDFLQRRLHLQPSHPLCIVRQLIESQLPSPTYSHYNDLSPIVTTHQNFDVLGFPPDHPGRSRTDTYYINSTTCLRTHTSAHQADVFKTNATEGYTIAADVYRRDAIDRSHYPVFHQMEGARLWDRKGVNGSSVARAINADLDLLAKHDLLVEDPNSTTHPEKNPLQYDHSLDEVEAIAAHLKRSLESLVVAIFDRVSAAANTAADPAADIKIGAPSRLRWVEAYFPFTSPSWELEVFWQGEWLEILGCGVVKQSILSNAGVPSKVGWAFGIGLERLAMLLYSIPDIRLFWSKDNRFLSQFAAGEPLKQFVPFSKYPGCPRDVAFWVRGAGSAAGGSATPDFHENDAMQVIREIGGDLVEHVKLLDVFQHPKTGRRSLCYNINYRSLERVISREEANELHEDIRNGLKDRLGVELR